MLSIGLLTGLGVFLGAALDLVLHNSAPVFAAKGGIIGAVVGVYYAMDLYRVRLAR